MYRRLQMWSPTSRFTHTHWLIIYVLKLNATRCLDYRLTSKWIYTHRFASRESARFECHTQMVHRVTHSDLIYVSSGDSAVVARRSHTPKVVSSILTHRIFHFPDFCDNNATEYAHISCSQNSNLDPWWDAKLEWWQSTTGQPAEQSVWDINDIASV